MDLGCFPFLCLTGLHQDGQLLFLSVPPDVKCMLSLKQGYKFPASEGLRASWSCEPLSRGHSPSWGGCLTRQASAHYL